MNSERAFHREVTPGLVHLVLLGGDGAQIPGRTNVMTRKRQRDSAAVERDESVDKVKLEIRRTDGGAKNVTCQVACGTAGGGIGRHLQSGDKKRGRVRMTDALWGRATRTRGDEMRGRKSGWR